VKVPVAARRAVEAVVTAVFAFGPEMRMYDVSFRGVPGRAVSGNLAAHG